MSIERLATEHQEAGLGSRSSLATSLAIRSAISACTESVNAGRSVDSIMLDSLTSYSALGPKQQILDALEREYARTKRVLRAYPDDKLDLKPHATARSARDLAWLLVMGSKLMVKTLTTGFDWSSPPQPPLKPPETVAAIVEALEREHKQVVDTLRPLDETKLATETVKFFVAPKTLDDIPKIEFLWFLLFDHVHHRGQFSIYLRIAGAKVPSIYGPSADEPWR